MRRGDPVAPVLPMVEVLAVALAFWGLNALAVLGWGWLR